MKKYYFKVYEDFARYIQIDETELEKALYAFQTGKGVIFENGALNRVESVLPDLNKECGWNADYKPQADDFPYLEAVKPKYAGIVGKTKDKIQYLIQKGRQDLIGKNVYIPELNQPQNPEISEATKQLAEKFKIHY